MGAFKSSQMLFCQMLPYASVLSWCTSEVKTCSKQAPLMCFVFAIKLTNFFSHLNVFEFWTLCCCIFIWKWPLLLFWCVMNSTDFLRGNNWSKIITSWSWILWVLNKKFHFTSQIISLIFMSSYGIRHKITKGWNLLRMDTPSISN